ncbi:MAG: hypothetical protein FJW40_13700 [Acidobacteria bacterium]|nr:hypothetical protein [Acidobacteriota bacterium]
MATSVSRQETYFLFPFSIDREIVMSRHPACWHDRHWIDGLDELVASGPGAGPLRHWKRDAYDRFDMDSPAYQDMVFFHTFVRRVFFDTLHMPGDTPNECLLRCYTLPAEDLSIHVEDVRGRSVRAALGDLRLFLFANGIGILSFKTSLGAAPARDALWLNEMLRKVCPSSGRQRREGRAPARVAVGSSNGIAIEETFERGEIRDFVPPISAILRRLLYFIDYGRREYEPVLDERMIVCSYFEIDPASVPPRYMQSEDYQQLLSQALYVDHEGPEFRYEPEFTRRKMVTQVYRRWAHQGTYYGFTSYSSVTMTFGSGDRGLHTVDEGFLIWRMFNTRYYLMAVIALFYRATLLDFEERIALVSRRLHRDLVDEQLTRENVHAANALRSDFLNFSNYWHFDELANKDEEIEHFQMQCEQYRIPPMKAEIQDEIERLNAALHDYNQRRSTQAVNRLAIISLMLGGAAVLTGFFGMNFGRAFSRLIFEPQGSAVSAHYLAILAVCVGTISAFGAALYLVLANWSDYRDDLRSAPRRSPLR